MRKLAVYATLIILANAAVVLWHPLTHAQFSSQRAYALGMIYAPLLAFLPMNALILLWANFHKAGGWLLLMFSAIPLAIFGREHFLQLGPENIFRIAPTEWTPMFQVSAVLLLVLELLGCWLSIRILRHRALVNVSA